jgi:hypothetical protein
MLLSWLSTCTLVWCLRALLRSEEETSHEKVDPAHCSARPRTIRSGFPVC